MIRYRLVTLGGLGASVRVLERSESHGASTIAGHWYTARLEPVALLFTRDGREFALGMNGEPLDTETLARWLAMAGTPSDMPSELAGASSAAPLSPPSP